jgi:hypothetical protein
MRWAGHVARLGEKRNAFKSVVVKPEGKRPVGRLTPRWEDNIRIDRGETGREGVYWIHLAQDMERRRALVNTVMKLRFPQKAGNFLTE